MQGTAGGEEEEDDESYGKAHSVHHTSSQGTKTQFPQDLQCSQKTVVGGLNIDKEREENTESLLALTFDNLWDFLKNNEKGIVNYKGRKGHVFCCKARFRCYPCMKLAIHSLIYEIFSNPAKVLHYASDIYIKIY